MVLGGIKPFQNLIQPTLYRPGQPSLLQHAKELFVDPARRLVVLGKRSKVHRRRCLEWGQDPGENCRHVT
ncbi:hypothetical protein GCM10008949_23410 [Deinococcus humi]|nr:hypothetical protein GCM10008949_23410 [Deinococcus humi]